MAGRKKDPNRTEATRNSILDNAYAMFTKENIESVTIGQIAGQCGCSEMTVYRYFSSKPELVVAVAAREWQRFQEGNIRRRPDPKFRGVTAAQIFEFYLDSFLWMYRDNRDLLRFNQFFNVYIQAENVDADTLLPYQKVIEGLREPFHDMYLLAERDHTLRTDVSEEVMFSTTLHLLLAAVTRYAVGLVYRSSSEPEQELLTLKEMLMRQYCCG